MQNEFVVTVRMKSSGNKDGVHDWVLSILQEAFRTASEGFDEKPEIIDIAAKQVDQV